MYRKIKWSDAELAKLNELLANPEISEVINNLQLETILEYHNGVRKGMFEGGLVSGLIVAACVGAGYVIKKHIRKTEKKRPNLEDTLGETK